LSGHMRLAPHVSSQGPLRPARSALRLSQAGLHRCSALRSSQPKGRMPFVKKCSAALTERLDVRISPAEKEQLRAIARSAGGIPVAELVRLRALGQPVVPRTDATTIRELRRLGGLLKKVHTDSHGAYAEATARALDALVEAIRVLAAGR
jgi:hypothetical protein